MTKTFKALAFMLNGPPPPRPSAWGEVGWAVYQSTPENERDWGSGSRHNNIVTRLWTAKLVEEKDGKQVVSEKGMTYLKVRGYKPKVLP